MRVLLLMSFVLLLHMAESQHQINICPTEDSKDCSDGITLQELASNHSLIQPNTILIFQPMDFSMEVLHVKDVSNITLDTQPGSKKPLLNCSIDHHHSIDSNDAYGYFLFENVSNVTIKNLDFSGCGSVNLKSSTLNFKAATNITISRVTIKEGRMCGVEFNNVYGDITISNALFTQMHGTSICLSQFFRSEPLPSQIKPTLKVTSSDFTLNNCMDNYYRACTLYADLAVFPHSNAIEITNVKVTFNTQRSNVSDIYISSSWHPSFISLSGYHRVDNSIIASLSPNESGGSDFYYTHKDDFYSSIKEVEVDIKSSKFTNNVIYSDTDDFDPFQAFIT